MNADEHGSSSDATQPNILFIISDQHNAKILGCKGHPDVLTPNIDRMAAEGVRFENAITQNPICTPSRMCYLSGQYAHNHGYYGLSGPNPNGLPTVLGHFKKYGYTTAAVGKIHCPEYWVEDDSDVYHETCGCSIGGRSQTYADFLQKRGKLELEDHGAMPDPEFNGRGQQSMEGRPSPLTFDESQEGWIAGTVIEFMRDAVEQGKPFFAHASLPRPHQCTAPSQEFWDLYEGKDLTLPPNTDYEMVNKAPHFTNAANNWRTGNWTLIEPKTFEAGRLRKLRGYLAAVSQVDHAVGLMLDFLRDNGLAENTIVIYTADHGDYAAEHDIMEKAPGICADAITRIPHVWWAPERFKAGHVADEIVETVDMSTTLCHLAGVEVLETSDGKDISHLLNGDPGEVHKVGVTEFAFSKSLRKGKYRLVYYPTEMFQEQYPDGFGELYDLEADPWEMTNLYFEPEHKEKVTELKEDLLEWIIRTTRCVNTNAVNSRRDVDSTQVHRRYHCDVLADNKIHPDWIINAPWYNYV